jgi:hypothetical protein
MAPWDRITRRKGIIELGVEFLIELLVAPPACSGVGGRL